MSILDVYVALSALVIAVLFSLVNTWQWYRFVKGEISAVDLSCMIPVCFGVTLTAGMVTGLILLPITGGEDLYMGAFLATQEFLAWLFILSPLQRRLSGYPVSHAQLTMTPERFQELKRSETFTNYLVQGGPM